MRQISIVSKFDTNPYHICRYTTVYWIHIGYKFVNLKFNFYHESRMIREEQHGYYMDTFQEVGGDDNETKKNRLATLLLKIVSLYVALLWVTFSTESHA